MHVISATKKHTNPYIIQHKILGTQDINSIRFSTTVQKSVEIQAWKYMYVRNTNCHTGRVKHHMKQVYNVCVLLLVPKGSPKSQKLVEK